jgi:hypothetical protein
VAPVIKAVFPVRSNMVVLVKTVRVLP